MWYGREVVGVEWVVGVEEVNDSGADMDIYRLLAVYVSLMAPKGQAPKGQANMGVL